MVGKPVLDDFPDEPWAGLLSDAAMALSDR
jgi:hypothetical protein